MKHIKITLSVLAFAIFAFNAQARDQIKIVGSSTVYPYANGYNLIYLNLAT